MTQAFAVVLTTCGCISIYVGLPTFRCTPLHSIAGNTAPSPLIHACAGERTRVAPRDRSQPQPRAAADEDSACQQKSVLAGFGDRHENQGHCLTDRQRVGVQDERVVDACETDVVDQPPLTSRRHVVLDGQRFAGRDLAEVEMPCEIAEVHRHRAVEGLASSHGGIARIGDGRRLKRREIQPGSAGHVDVEHACPEVVRGQFRFKAKLLALRSGAYQFLETDPEPSTDRHRQPVLRQLGIASDFEKARRQVEVELGPLRIDAVGRHVDLVAGVAVREVDDRKAVPTFVVQSRIGSHLATYQRTPCGPCLGENVVPETGEGRGVAGLHRERIRIGQRATDAHEGTGGLLAGDRGKRRRSGREHGQD